MDSNLWQSDRVLSAIDVDRFALFSVDLFETLLLRRVERCEALFAEVGRRAAVRGWVDPGVTPGLFANLRLAAARKAEAAQDTPVGIEAIYRRLPAGLVAVDSVRALEVETEADLIVVNPFLASFLQFLHDRGRPVVAVSDMYLPARDITTLITRAGGNPTLFHRLYVSCDAGVHKRDGGLFRRLLTDFPTLSPERICHIGDDPIADGVAPRRLRLATVSYGVSPTLSALTAREATVAGRPESLRDDPARRLASRQVETTDGPDGFWTAFGALVLGPVLVRYAGFVVEQCRRLGIGHVAPLMREGRLLSRLIALIAQQRGIPLTVRPLYVSRLAMGRTQAPGFDRDGLFDLLERRPYLRLGDLLTHGAGAPIPAPLAGLADRPLEALASECLSGGGLVLEYLADWLAQPAVARSAATAAAAARALTLRYLCGNFGDAPAVALVDLGARATTAGAIHRLTEISARYRLRGFLLYATGEVEKVMADGLPVSVYAGADTDALQAGRLLYRSPQPIERLLTGLDDCTAGYAEQADGSVAPVTIATAATGWEREALRAAEDGVMHYWTCWSHTGLALDPEAPANGEAVLPWTAALMYPTPAEAQALGALTYDYNDGSTWVRTICDAAALAAVRPLLTAEPGALMARLLGLRPQAAPWPQGTATLLDPDALRRHHRAVAALPDHRALCEPLVTRIKRAGVGAVIAYAAGGAGGMGEAFIAAAQEAGLAVTAYLDRLPQAVGEIFCGVPVIALSQLAEVPQVPVALVTLGYRDAMRADIVQMFNERTPRLFTLDDP